MKKFIKKVKQISMLLLVISLIGCESDDELMPKVISGFTYTVNADTGTVTFINTSVNSSNYYWEFGDGTSSTTKSPVKTYTTGDYIVNLKAANVEGASDIFEAIIIILVGVTPDLFSTLIFSDEFNEVGSPDNTKWGFDIGTGCPNICGWGNAEEQYYTSRTDNVSVKDGFLTIKAKKENYNGASFTSAKMLTKGKFDFTYGRVEVRAKLPEGKGTWPAIWMLGDNIDTVGWPACGEIDIIEHFGKSQGTVSSAMHTPSSFGNTVNHGDQFLADVSTEFHTYVVEWTAEEIVFKVDDVEHYRYNPSSKNSSTWPYDADQYLILNIALGGTAGGSIDSNFTESSMEIDYVRVYQ